jgi:Tol biopolymer transport system component/DNA-binding winged helix-turn-helix (wHTH) protein
MQGDFQVGERLVSPKLNRLTRDGQEIRIEPKAMQVLVYLAGRPNEVASREELIRHVWPDTFVTDDVLKRCISDLRKALGDNRDNPQFIETISKGGYRLIGQVLPSALAPGNPKASEANWRFRIGPARIMGVVLAMTLGVVMVGLYSFRARPQPDLRVFPLTSLPGWEVGVLSPDGTHLAFTWNAADPAAEDRGHLYVKAVGAASPRRLSDGPEYVHSPAWSPDGRSIAFLRSAADPTFQDIVIVPVTGGSERVVGRTRSEWHGLDWSPDERFLAINDRETADSPDGLYLFSLEDGQKRRLVASPPGHDGDSSPRFSPDGRSLAFVRQRLFPYTADVYVLDLPSGNVKRVTSDDEFVSGVDWMPDGRNLVFSSARILGDRHLWTVAATGGAPRRIGITERWVENPSIARRGRLLLAYSDLQIDRSIWRVPGPSGDPKAVPLRIDQSTRGDYYPNYSPDGQRIGFVSARSGYPEVWVSDNNGTNQKQVTFLNRPFMRGSAWSPDGQWLTFSTTVDGHVNIYVVPANGGFPVRVTRESNDQIYPSFSHDGQHIYFCSRLSGSDEIWMTPVGGGRSVQVTHNGGVEARESSDGRYLYYTKRHPSRGALGLWRMRLPDGGEQRIVEVGITGLWALFDGGVCYVDYDSESRPSLNCLDPDRATTRQIPIPETNRTLAGLAVSPDGRWILYGRGDTTGFDVIGAEGFWPKP